ncbi:hypothetical protein VNO77_15931 [Canavalia gladiata]|uniref:Uncharacterized protein n=1 Tax=Canavalia gladiata TaxID=3824 RepID=A0AAN9M065_CANGL
MIYRFIIMIVIIFKFVWLDCVLIQFKLPLPSGSNPQWNCKKTQLASSKFLQSLLAVWPYQPSFYSSYG